MRKNRKHTTHAGPATSFAEERRPVELVADVRRTLNLTRRRIAAIAFSIAAVVLTGTSVVASTVGVSDCTLDDGTRCVRTVYYPLSVVPRVSVTTRAEDGVREGPTTEWFWHGQVAIAGDYLDGEKNGVWRELWPNGNRRFEGSYRRGQRDGDERWWYESGALEWQGRWRDGAREGADTWWYESGAKRRSRTFERGRVTGPVESFAEDGTPVLTQSFDDGVDR